MAENNEAAAVEDDLDLWIREPESAELDAKIVAARLCSCSDVCLAVIEDGLD